MLLHFLSTASFQGRPRLQGRVPGPVGIEAKISATHPGYSPPDSIVSPQWPQGREDYAQNSYGPRRLLVTDFSGHKPRPSTASNQKCPSSSAEGCVWGASLTRSRKGIALTDPGHFQNAKLPPLHPTAPLLALLPASYAKQ